MSISLLVFVYFLRHSFKTGTYHGEHVQFTCLKKYDRVKHVDTLSVGVMCLWELFRHIHPVVRRWSVHKIPDTAKVFRIVW